MTKKLMWYIGGQIETPAFQIFFPLRKRSNYSNLKQ